MKQKDSKETMPLLVEKFLRIPDIKNNSEKCSLNI